MASTRRHSRGSEMTHARFIALIATSLISLQAQAQSRPDPAALIAAQKQAMLPLAVMDGIWRGAASTVLPSGQKHDVTQTERIGPFLDGSIKVIEGRGYDAEGKVTFNAFGTVSYDVGRRDTQFTPMHRGKPGAFLLPQPPAGKVGRFPRGRLQSFSTPAPLR